MFVASNDIPIVAAVALTELTNSTKFVWHEERFQLVPDLAEDLISTMEEDALKICNSLDEAQLNEINKLQGLLTDLVFSKNYPYVLVTNQVEDGKVITSLTYEGDELATITSRDYKVETVRAIGINKKVNEQINLFVSHSNHIPNYYEKKFFIHPQHLASYADVAAEHKLRYEDTVLDPTFIKAPLRLDEQAAYAVEIGILHFIQQSVVAASKPVRIRGISDMLKAMVAGTNKYLEQEVHADIDESLTGVAAMVEYAVKGDIARNLNRLVEFHNNAYHLDGNTQDFGLGVFIEVANCLRNTITKVDSI